MGLERREPESAYESEASLLELYLKNVPGAELVV
jgi:hypothetical protein